MVIFKSNYRFIAIVFFILILVFTGFVFVQNILMAPVFLKYERVELEKNIKRVVSLLDSESDHLLVIANDWAEDDELVSYISFKQKDYAPSKLKSSVFLRNNIDFISILDENSNLILSADYNYDIARVLNYNKGFQDEIDFMEISKYRNGLFEINGDLYLLAVAVVSKPENLDNILGYIILGRKLNEERIKELGLRIKVDFKLNPKKYYSEANSDFKEETIVKNNKLSVWHMVRTIKDIRNRDDIILQLFYTRELPEYAKRTMCFGLIYVLISVVLILGLIVYFVKHKVLKPIEVLNRHIQILRKNNAYNLRLKNKNIGILGQLSRSFDSLMATIEKQTEELERMTVIDGLTGIYNRRKFNETIVVEWRRHKRHKKQLSLILLDVDYFKLYNDHYGHQQGDECLKAIANVIKQNVKRSGEIIARYGGEEFGVILPSTDKESVLIIGERLLSAVGNLKIPHAKSKVSKYVTYSLGISTIYPNNNISYSEFIKAADDGLYSAKQKGRNRMVVNNIKIEKK